MHHHQGGPVSRRVEVFLASVAVACLASVGVLMGVNSVAPVVPHPHAPGVASPRTLATPWALGASGQIE